MTHLDALEMGRSNEARRLAVAKTPAEKKLRQVWLAQCDKEIAFERQFLGLAPIAEAEIDDDALLTELFA